MEGCFLFLALCVLVVVPVSSELWIATTGPVTVSVDTTTFNYTVELRQESDRDGGLSLGDGQVAIQCGGTRYSSSGAPARPLVGGVITTKNGTDPRIGPYRSIERTWIAASCTSIITAIRQYRSTNPVLSAPHLLFVDIIKTFVVAERMHENFQQH